MAFAKYVLFMLLCLSATAEDVLELRPQDVVDQVLSRSLEAQVISLKAQDAFVAYEEVLGRFDFNLSSRLSYEYREAQAVSGFNNFIDRSLLGSVTLNKWTGGGGQVEFGYSHEAHSSVLNVISSQLRPPSVAFDTGYVQWRQKLWSNPFGLSDRLEVNVAREALRNADLTKQEETEDLVLEALRLYWEVFVAQTQLQDAMHARAQYSDLVEVVKRRGRFGLEKGGEYAQVMAEFTESDNQVKLASFNYLDKMKSLELMMQTEFTKDLRFEVGDMVPKPPSQAPVEARTLRKVQVAEAEQAQAISQERATNWRQQPNLDLVARAASTGMDERPGAAYSEFVSGTKPTYYVGLEFSTPLDSAGRRAQLAKARVATERAANQLRRLRQEQERLLHVHKVKLESAFIVAQGALEAERFRSRTVKEQEVEYKQGRMPLRELLQTYRNYFDAQSRKVRAVGDYHIALNELAAVRDELVR